MHHRFSCLDGKIHCIGTDILFSIFGIADEQTKGQDNSFDAIFCC
jgi:hypothetical protein